MTKTITIPNSDSDESIEVHLPAADRLGNSRSMTYYTLFYMNQLPALRDQLDEILDDRQPGLACANCDITCSTSVPAGFALKGQVWCSSCYETRDQEIGRWQNAIRDELRKLADCPPNVVNGKGPAGDELALTLIEIGQAFRYREDQLEGAAAQPSAELAGPHEPGSTAVIRKGDANANEPGLLVEFHEGFLCISEDRLSAWRVYVVAEDVPKLIAALGGVKPEPSGLKETVHAAVSHGLCMAMSSFVAAEVDTIAAEVLDAVRPFMRPAEPTPDLKEALGRALRSWKYEDRSLDGLMAHGIEMDREHLMPLGIAKGLVGEIVGHLAEAVAPFTHDCPSLGNQPPDLEGVARKVEAEAAAEDVEAAILHVLVREVDTVEPLTYLARKIVAALPPALTAEEAKAIRWCAAWAHAEGGPRTRRDAELARAAVDRLSAVPGSPESDEEPEATGSKGSQDGEDDDAISGLLQVDPAATAEYVMHTRQMAEDLGARVARLDARVQALELHRRGLTDGQAEAATGATLCACGHPAWEHSPGCWKCSCGGFRPRVEIVGSGEGTGPSV